MGTVMKSVAKFKYFSFDNHLLSLSFAEPLVSNVRRPWSDAEKNAVNKHLAKFMAERRVPGKDDCLRCIKEEEVLGQRSWKDVKNFVHNTIATLNRQSASRHLKF